MARTFENPMNGHQETVDGSASFGVFFLGLFYLLYKGLWGHVLVWSLLVIAPTIAFTPLIIFALPTASIAYAIGIQEVMARRYLNDGWREVTGDGTKLLAQRATEPQPAPTSTSETRLCPYCAEEIKVAAIRCKHCQSDLPPSDDLAAVLTSA